MANEEFRFTDGIKKVLLAGLGAVSIGADKSKEVLDILVKRGEETAEQAKSFSKDLSEQSKPQIQNLAEKVVSVTTKTRDRAAEALKGRKIVINGKEIDLSEVVGSLSLEQLEALKEGLGAKKQEKAEEAAGAESTDAEPADADAAGAEAAEDKPASKKKASAAKKSTAGETAPDEKKPAAKKAAASAKKTTTAKKSTTATKKTTTAKKSTTAAKKTAAAKKPAAEKPTASAEKPAETAPVAPPEENKTTE